MEERVVQTNMFQDAHVDHLMRAFDIENSMPQIGIYVGDVASPDDTICSNVTDEL